MTQTHQTDARPEARFARHGFANLRGDLLSDPFGYDPLPPLRAGWVARWEKRLPGGLGRYVRWLPHGAVLAAAVLFFLVSTTKTVEFRASGALFDLVFTVLVSMSVGMVVFRPVGAYWMSLCAVVLSLPTSLYSFTEPRTEIAMAGHLFVMVLVVLRTRPRVAAEMWLVTVAVSTLLAALTGGVMTALPSIATFAAVALVTAAAIRAWRQERQHVVETETVTARERSRRTLLEERNTIARELHDVLAHHMSVIAIQAEAAPYRVAEPPPELATSFATIRENAVAALTELRRILGVVRAEDPDAYADDAPQAPQPTLADLDALYASVRSAGLEVDSVVTGAVAPLSQGVELSAYRIVQEALSNALRHSPGAPARVELSYVLGGLGVRVVNGPPEQRPSGPGGGARAAAPPPRGGGGHGLLGMRERVQVLGGEMTASGTPEGGFEVAVFLPAGTATPTEAEGSAGSAGSGRAAAGSGPAAGPARPAAGDGLGEGAA
ncbi:histidine kinase [Streptomyces diacarni]|uniref:sensor histidine kinase n=1 Tax=Streptomyces diacarni TaxID=2800381 RepID=UPI0033C527AD